MVKFGKIATNKSETTGTWTDNIEEFSSVCGTKPYRRKWNTGLPQRHTPQVHYWLLSRNLNSQALLMPPRNHPSRFSPAGMPSIDAPLPGIQKKPAPSKPLQIAPPPPTTPAPESAVPPPDSEAPATTDSESNIEAAFF